jgi:hypothetical protein
MGNRINKAIGWAISCSEDPVDRESDQALAPMVVYAAWLTSKMNAATDADEKLLLECEAAMLTFGPDSRMCTGDSAVWAEHLDGGTLIVMPPFLGQSWHRSDDPIDHAFADGLVGNRLTFSDWRFHPYEGLWMDADTGAKLNHYAAKFRRAAARSGADDASLDLLAAVIAPFGTPAPGPYVDRHEALASIVPIVPLELRWLAEYLGLFSTPEDVLKLRPARAVWWG